MYHRHRLSHPSRLSSLIGLVIIIFVPSRSCLFYLSHTLSCFISVSSWSPLVFIFFIWHQPFLLPIHPYLHLHPTPVSVPPPLPRTLLSVFDSSSSMLSPATYLSRFSPKGLMKWSEFVCGERLSVVVV
ncbi:hypothetical protein DFH29DRAFT_929972 [Suillus ampliporus]|nr:hypothetical protein DFH29DRAFT_929972 [Suillus ampliporus]